MKHLHYSLVIGIVALTMVLVTLAPAGAEPPDGKGKKGDVGKSVEGFLYGDLYVIERDGNGQPVLYGEEATCCDPERDRLCATVDGQTAPMCPHVQLRRRLETGSGARCAMPESPTTSRDAVGIWHRIRTERVGARAL